MSLNGRLVGLALRGIMSYSTGWWGGSSRSGSWRRLECKESNSTTEDQFRISFQQHRTSFDFMHFCLWLQNIAFCLARTTTRASSADWDGDPSALALLDVYKADGKAGTLRGILWNLETNRRRRHELHSSGMHDLTWPYRGVLSPGTYGQLRPWTWRKRAQRHFHQCPVPCALLRNHILDAQVSRVWQYILSRGRFQIKVS